MLQLGNWPKPDEKDNRAVKHIKAGIFFTRFVSYACMQTNSSTVCCLFVDAVGMVVNRHIDIPAADRQVFRESRRSAVKMTIGGAVTLVVGAACSTSDLRPVASGGRAAGFAGVAIMTVGLVTYIKVVWRTRGRGLDG
jgi:hypothetical protein